MPCGQLAAEAHGLLCRRILEAGTPGLHMYTLNLEGGAVSILEQLGLIDRSKVRSAELWAVVPACCFPSG